MPRLTVIDVARSLKVLQAKISKAERACNGIAGPRMLERSVSGFAELVHSGMQYYVQLIRNYHTKKVAGSRPHVSHGV
jgi:hypothetical protein